MIVLCIFFLSHLVSFPSFPPLFFSFAPSFLTLTLSFRSFIFVLSLSLYLLTMILTLLFYLHSSLIPLPPSCACCFLSLSFVFVQPSMRALIWTNKPLLLRPVMQESTYDNPRGHGVCQDWRVPALLCHAPAGITRLLCCFGGQIGRARPSPRPRRLHCHISKDR